MKFVIWNMRSLYKPVSVKTVARELVEHRLDSLIAQVVTWVRRGTDVQTSIFFME